MPKRPRDAAGGYAPSIAAPAAGSPPPTDPYAYQDTGIEWLKQRPHALLGDEMGLGKTRQLLLSAVEPVLVVAPAMIIDSGNWDDECKKWAPGMDVTQTAYSRIVTRAGGKVTAKLPAELADRRWGTLILDEAHYVKGRRTTWTNTARQLADHSEQVHTATGTPIPNWAHEAFTLLQLAWPEKNRPGGELGSYWRWAERWFDCSPTRFSQGQPSVGRLLGCGLACAKRRATDPCQHYLEFARANFGDRMLRRTLDQVGVQLPPLREIEVHCPMTTKQAKVYRDLKRDYMALVDGTEIVAWNDGSRYSALLKAATGLQVVDPSLTGSGKLDQLQEHLHGRSRPALVFGHFNATVEAAAATARKAGADAEFIHGGTSPQRRAEIAAAFKRGDLGVLVGSLEVLAEGLTFTQADLCIFVEKSVKPYRNAQAMKRIHRIGQTRPVTVYDYVTPGTVDENVRRLVAEKTDDQVRTLSAADFARLL